MHFFVFILSISIVMVQGYVQYQPYHSDNVYPYSSYPLIEGRSPNVGHLSRLFWSWFSLTTTTRPTTTTTITCTVLTVLDCVGRRRSSLLLREEDSIEPSPVNKMEATPLAELDFATRVEHKATPQFAYWRGGSDNPSHLPLPSFVQRPVKAIYNSYARHPIIVDDLRFLFYQTSATTLTRTTTSRSTPICSQPSGFKQC